MKNVRSIQALAVSATLALALTACGAAGPVATPTVHIILLPTATPGAIQSAAGTAQAPPPATGGQQQGAGTGNADRGGQFSGRAASGAVKSVQGNTLVISEQNGSVVTATVNADTSYVQDKPIKVSDLKAGDQVSAVGVQNTDNTVTAQRLTAGATGQMGGFGSAPGAFIGGPGRSGTPGAFATPGAGGQSFQRQSGTPSAAGTPPAGGFGGQRQGGNPGASGTPGTGGQRQGGNPNASGTPGTTQFGGQFANAAFVVGAVQKIDGNTVTIAEANGQTRSVLVTADTQLTSVVPATLSDVKPGAEVTVVGQPSADGTVAATVVQIGSIGSLR